MRTLIIALFSLSFLGLNAQTYTGTGETALEALGMAMAEFSKNEPEAFTTNYESEEEGKLENKKESVTKTVVNESIGDLTFQHISTSYETESDGKVLIKEEQASKFIFENEEDGKGYVEIFRLKNTEDGKIYENTKIEGMFEKVDIVAVFNYVEDKGYSVSHQIIETPTTSAYVEITHKITLSKK